MTNYMPKVGQYGIDMMYRTCTVQTNLDFSSEADMVKKLRVSVALQPVATALFANSPFTEGKPNGFLSFRSEIWRDTDNARSGMIPWAFEHGMGFERWVDYALDVPMYFVKRGDTYIDVSGSSFRDFFHGKNPAFPGERPTLSDWANHLSTIFPEVRLKRYLEMRRRKPERGLGPGQPLDRAGASGVARRRPAPRLQGQDQGALSVRDRPGMREAVAFGLAAAQPHRSFGPRREPLPRTAGADPRIGPDAGARDAGEIRRRLGRLRGTGLPGIRVLKHDPEKWLPVFRKDHAQIK
jgi:hypothetical protein